MLVLNCFECKLWDTRISSVRWERLQVEKAWEYSARRLAQSHHVCAACALEKLAFFVVSVVGT